MPKTKHEKRFFELFKDNTPVECARILVDEERARWEDAINELHETWRGHETCTSLLNQVIDKTEGGLPMS